MTPKRPLALLAAALPALGCAAYLKEPVRVRTPEAYLVKRTAVSEREQGSRRACVVEVSAEIVYLPLGEEQRIDSRRGFLASNQLSVQLHESGTLRQVALNSDPQADEALAAAGDLVRELASAAATLAPLAALAPAARPGAEAPACVPDVSLRLAPLACFLDPRPPGLEGRCPADPARW
jgi:hypothetical protein